VQIVKAPRHRVAHSLSEVNGTLILVELAGHVGLLLWGTHMVGTGVQRGFGPTLRGWLGHNLASPGRAFVTGLGITTLLQSSTATGLLATSFAATGVIALAPALAVMLGANVGTALLTQLLSLNMALVGPPLVLAGVLAFRWASAVRAKNIGRIGIGLGLMLMALAGLVHTLGPLENSPMLRPLMGSLSGDPVLALLIAALMTWACHSSIAMVLLVGSFEAGHVVGPTGALALVLGANLGGALPALLNASPGIARRLPLGNLLVRASGVLLALPFLPEIADLLIHYSGSARMVVNFHLVFNVVLAIAFLGPLGSLARLLTRWLPDPPQPVDPGRPLHLDAAALDSATVALANASRETLRLGDMLESMLRNTLELMCGDAAGRSTAPARNPVADAARSVNQVGEAIRRYLAEIGDEPKRGQDILSAVINLEHAADIIATSAAEFSLRQQKRGKRLSTEEIGIVGAMHAELLRCLRLALAVFLQAEPGDADRLVASKRNFREYEAAAVALSAQLLRSAASQRLGDAESAARVVEESGLFLRSVRDLRRIHSHLASFAYPVLHRPRDLERPTPASVDLAHGVAAPTAIP
jgi:phosphate:Na+ symporter